LDNYSIGQIALISHVAYLKMEDEKKELEKDGKGGKKGGRRILNPNDKDNAAAYMMVASGLLG
jgi:hypothetical protein